MEKKFSGSYRELIGIAAPLMVGQLAHNLISWTDVHFVGKVGEVELAAIGYVGAFYFLVIIIGFYFARGAQVLIARKDGEGKTAEVGAIINNSTLLFILLSVLFFVGSKFLSRPILSLLLDSEAVADACADYMDVRAYGFLFGLMSSVLLSYFSGIRKTNILAISVSITLLSNYLLNKMFVLGEWGFEPMGIRGSALASNFAEALGVLIAAIYAAFSPSAKLYKPFRNIRISIPLLKEMMWISAPLVVQGFISLFSWFLFFTYIEKYGEFDLAVTNVVKQVFLFFAIPAFTFSSCVNTAISNLLGQLNIREIKKVLNRLVIMSFLITLAGMIILVFTQDFWFGIFTPRQNEIAGAGETLIYIVPALLIMSVSVVVFNGVVSTGSTWTSLGIEIASIIVYMAYTTICFKVYHCKTAFGWTNEWVYWIFNLVAAIIFLNSGRWAKPHIDRLWKERIRY